MNANNIGHLFLGYFATQEMCGTLTAVGRASTLSFVGDAELVTTRSDLVDDAVAFYPDESD